MSKPTTRRKFLAQSGALATGSALATTSPLLAGAPVHVAHSDEIKVAVVGMGGRGSGAVGQILSAEDNVRLVSIADTFPGSNSFKSRLESLRKKYGKQADVAPDRIFDGIDGYKKAIDSGVDLVVIATPPGFKPQQYEYAVKNNKHVFMEKPVASDVPGVRRVLAATAEAKKKSLMVGIGLQRRHQDDYQDCVKALQDGAIGDINLLRVYWNGGGIWYRERTRDMTEMQFQVNNWYHYIWLSGDQICEQHIHNIDVGCWVKGMFPVMANGMGGSEMREQGDKSRSQIFDHTFVEYTFEDGSKMYSQGRHLKGGMARVGEFAHGSKGQSKVGAWIDSGDKKRQRFRRTTKGGHLQEQLDLIAALRRGEIYNEGYYGAMSTFTAILGREACYSGKEIRAEKLMQTGRDYCPGIDEYKWDTTPPTVPDENGNYPVPLPGIYNPFA